MNFLHAQTVGGLLPPIAGEEGADLLMPAFTKVNGADFE